MSKWITEADDAEVTRILHMSRTELLAEIAARGETEADVLARVQEVQRRVMFAKASAFAAQREQNNG